jgi:hypothetical protein
MKSETTENGTGGIGCEEMGGDEDSDCERLVIKTEDDSILEPQTEIMEEEPPDSPTRRHQEFLRHVVEINSNRS